MKWKQRVDERPVHLMGASCKKRHMMNKYLTDSHIVDLFKDHEEVNDKTNEHFKDKVKKDCLWERFASSCKLSVKVLQDLV